MKNQPLKKFAAIHHADQETIQAMYDSYGPVFILTTGRSGSKFITRLLNRSLNIDAHHEPSPALQYFSDFAFHHQENIDILTKMIDAARMELVLNAFIEKKIYVESNQCLTFFAPVIETLFKKAKFIHLVRHPANFVISAIKKGWFMKDSIWESGRVRMKDDKAWNRLDPVEKLCWLWYRTNQFIENFKKQVHPGKIMTVKSEALFHDENSVQALFKFAGATPIPSGMIKKTQQTKINELIISPDDPDNIKKLSFFPELNAWSKKNIRSLKKYTSTLSKLYGYDISGVKIPSPRIDSEQRIKVKNSDPLISIVIPNYNNEKYIRECVESVLNQTYKNIEIVISDDSSTDHSCDIIKEYEQNHPGRVKGLFIDTNQGVAFNRNHAISHSKGEYLTTLDSDDFYCDPGKLKREMDLITTYKQQDGSDIIAFSNIVMVSEDGTFLKEQWPDQMIREGNIFDKVLTRSCMIPRDFLLLRQAYIDCGGYDPLFKTHQDWDLKLRLMAQYQCYFTGIDGIAYRQHGKGNSSLPIDELIKNLWGVFHKNISSIPHIQNRQKFTDQFSLFMEQFQLKAQNEDLLIVCQERLALIHRLNSECKTRDKIIKDLHQTAEKRLDLIHHLEKNSIND